MCNRMAARVATGVRGQRDVSRKGLSLEDQIQVVQQTTILSRALSDHRLVRALVYPGRRRLVAASLKVSRRFSLSGKVDCPSPSGLFRPMQNCNRSGVQAEV